MTEGLCQSGIVLSAAISRPPDFHGPVEVAPASDFRELSDDEIFRWFETLIEMGMLFFLDTFCILT